MIPFVKMQGIGNDFVVLDAIAHPDLPGDLGEFSRKVCDRKFGVGADGILTLERGETEPFRMRMFNPDGSVSEMCGNGLRCVARLIGVRNYADEADVSIETGAGVLHAKVGEQVSIDMGKYDLTPSAIGLQWSGERFVDELVSKSMRGTAVSMGNPHLVIFSTDVAAVELDHVGPIFEHHPWFANRTNVHFVQVVDRGHLIQRTWERGAGATLACGTGACACAVAGVLTDRSDRSVDVDLPGGRLHIDVAEDATVTMSGPAEIVFEGSWLLPHG